MGLDSYLYGERYHGIDFRNRDKPPKKVDGFPLKYERVEMGYWRKRWDIHTYIVNNFAGGKDECQEISLGSDRLKQIIQAIREKTLHHRPAGVGEPLNMSDWPPEVDETSAGIFEKALAWVEQPNTGKDKNVHRSVIYRASW
jgi:hypothetical protein